MFVVLVHKSSIVRVNWNLLERTPSCCGNTVFPLRSGKLVSTRESRASLSFAPVNLKPILTIFFHTELAHKHTETFKELSYKKWFCSSRKNTIWLMKTHLGACFSTLMSHHHRYLPRSAKLATEGYHIRICGYHRDKMNGNGEKKCFGQQLHESVFHHSDIGIF